MKWLLRPSSLIFVSMALALGAATLALWPRIPANRALPLAVDRDDREIVWLYAATNSAPWERFVSAIRVARDRLEKESGALGFEIDDCNAFPEQTTTVPEVALAMRGVKGRLWLRWYKLTSDLKTRDWVAALLQRRPPPLAIIGGSTSDLAIDLARTLKVEATKQRLGADSPLLLLTTATADAAGLERGQGEPPPLTSLYPGLTYRFCFTNRQMAEAVTSFIWSQLDLRPDADPFYVTFWQDDPYSTDLNQRFCDALRAPAYHAAARDWAWQAGAAALGNVPLDLGILWGTKFRLPTPYESGGVLYSVGDFSRPNRWEVKAATEMMETMDRYPQQRRPLLVVPAQTQPARRFLRALVREAPVQARRFVVATGDAIAFNTIYRDRNIAWQIQDLPFTLVLFCHRNPIDPGAGFPLEAAMQHPESGEAAETAAGTEDLLLFVDMIHVLAQGCARNDATGGGNLPPNAAALGQRLKQVHWSEQSDGICSKADGQLLFDENGNRRSSTGEHVVLLRPSVRGRKVLPEAQIEVCTWQVQEDTGKHAWRRPDRPLVVRYEGYMEQETGENANADNRR